MNNNYPYITPMIESFNIIPRIVQLYFPPINWKGDPKGHIGNSDAFFFVVSGECCVIVDGECHILKSGDLAFMPKGEMRSYFSMCKDLTMYEINFEAYINGEPWHKVLGISKENGNLMVHIDKGEDIAKLFEDSLRYEMNKDVLYDVVFSANISLIIREYILEYNRRKKLTTPFTSVLSYMRQNIDKSLKVEDFASVCYMQPTYFIKKFKSALGDSPIVYFNKLKIYKAMLCLTSEDMSVLDASRAVGIYDSSYFSKMFKKICNMTPSEYKSATEN